MNVAFVTPTEELQIPDKMIRWIQPCRYKIARGGRGGAKSRTCAAILVRKAAREALRWLCAREVQKSIQESVYRLLVGEIKRQRLTHHFDIQKTKIIGKYTEAEFVFIGLQEHTADSLKSYEDFDGIWVEEGHTVSAASWEIIVPTFRNRGSEIWITYNPRFEDDACHVMCRDALESGDPDFLIVDINFDDNPWFPPELEAERLRMLRINPDLYRHIWQGECRSVAGLVFKREWFKRYDRLPSSLNKYIASDYAVTPDGGDFTEHGVWGIDSESNLYAVAWWQGQTDPDTWIQAWLELVKQHKPRKAFEEKGVILRSVNGAINRAMREAEKFVIREALPSASNKVSRALGFAARASAGTVYFPKTQWADRIIDQLCGFNGEEGRIDDSVDVCSLIGRALDQIHNAAKPPAPKPSPSKVFSDEWFEKLHKQDQAAREAEEARFK